jgi:hypothetical protein
MRTRKIQLSKKAIFGRRKSSLAKPERSGMKRYKRKGRGLHLVDELDLNEYNNQFM